MSAERVLLYDGHKTWRILKPCSGYGKSTRWSAGEDRRVEEECVVHGDLDDALRTLHRLERADARAADLPVQGEPRDACVVCGDADNHPSHKCPVVQGEPRRD